MKLRVLHVIPNFGSGGAERLVVDLLDNSDKERFEMAAVSLYPESRTNLEKELKRKEIKVFYLNKHIGFDISMFYKLYRLFRAFRPDVIHTHLSVLRYTLLPMFLCRTPRGVHTIHNLAQKEVDLFGKFIHKFAFICGNIVPVSISTEIADSFHRQYGKRIFSPVIINGIPTAKFSLNKNKGMEKKGKRIILHIGRFSAQKNHSLLIEAFSLALRRYPEMELWLVGDGPLRSRIEEIIKAKKIESKVVFWGVRDDVSEILAEADIFILSSDWEGVPLTVLEAMASQKPVIATSVGGLPTIIENEINGFLVPPADIYSLAKTLLRLLDDPTLCKKIAIEAQKKILDKFDISKTTNEYEKLYASIVQK